MGRFVNADSIIDTKQGLLSKNVFAYCENNPVLKIDTTGKKSALANLLEVYQCTLISAINTQYAVYDDYSGMTYGGLSYPSDFDYGNIHAGEYLGYELATNDYVSDVSVSVSNSSGLTGKVGLSRVFSFSKGINATYFHAGIGMSTPWYSPINISGSAGKVINMKTAADYEGWFNSVGANVALGFDHSYAPGKHISVATQSKSLTVSSSVGVYRMMDYYWRVK